MGREKLQKTIQYQLNKTFLSRAALHASIFALVATLFAVIIPPLAADARNYFYHDFDSKLENVQTELKEVRKELEKLKKTKPNS
ncbi:hypothetical protein ACNSN2_14430 [Pseudoalteromonas sp. US3C1013]|uniref:hypothetical protein n=1 Tax=unclassified Pseudoalteromonas TaxID=194690 RepID=UPI003AB18F28